LVFAAVGSRVVVVDSHVYRVVTVSKLIDYAYDFFTPKSHSPAGVAFSSNPYEVFANQFNVKLPWGMKLGRSSKVLSFSIAFLCLLIGYFSSFNAFFAAGLGWIVWSRLMYLSVWHCMDGIEVKKVKIQERAQEKTQISMTITLRNSNVRPVYDLLVYLPCAATSEGAVWACVPKVEPNSTARVNLTFHSDTGMGRFEFDKILLSVSDVFGLHTLTLSHDIEATLTISPDVIPLLDFPLPEGFISSPLGYWETGQAGQSCNFLQLRPWRPGDSIRHVHWARSLRADELLVQSFESTAHVQATFVLDHHPAGHCHFGKLSSLETLRDSLFSLACYCNSHHLETRVLTDQWDTGMGRGAQQVGLIAHMLVHTNLDGSKHINQLLIDASEEIAPRSLLVLFFTTGGFHIEAALETIYELLQRQVHIVLIGVDSMAFGLAVAKDAKLYDNDALMAIREFERLFKERDHDDEVQRVKSHLSANTYLLRPGTTLADIVNFGEAQHD